jgi:hypothetical protein
MEVQLIFAVLAVREDVNRRSPRSAGGMGVCSGVIGHLAVLLKLDGGRK